MGDDFFDTFFDTVKLTESEIDVLTLDDYNALIAEAKVALAIDLLSLLRSIYKCPYYYISLENHEIGLEITLRSAWTENCVLVEVECNRGTRKFKIPFQFISLNNR
jgi:hypothetical protein